MTKQDLEILIYTSSEDDLLSLFQEKLKVGLPLSEYKSFQSLIYDLDIECIEFAIARLSHIDNLYDHSKHLAILIPILAAYLTMFFNFLNKNVLGIIGIICTGFSACALLYIVKKERKKRTQAFSVLKIFEQVKSRKEKVEN